MNILRDLFGPGTWGAGGNIAAAPILGGASALVTWILHRLGLLVKLTDAVGTRLAAWWARHHGPHAIEQHKQALREHEEAKASGQDHGTT